MDIVFFIMMCLSFFDGYPEEGKSNIVSPVQEILDGDGNSYTFITSCGLDWLVQNWKFNSVGSRVYNDEEANRAIYGGLYTWDQAMALVLPAGGWRIPSSADWTTLADCWDQNPGKVKEVGLDHWYDPNCGDGGLPSDNESGFTALGAGHYDPVFGGGIYMEQMVTSFMWLSTVDELDNTKAYAGDLWYSYNVLCAGLKMLKYMSNPVRLCRNHV
jgi:uncharacterized protein (TIGR02145 family)